MKRYKTGTFVENVVDVLRTVELKVDVKLVFPVVTITGVVDFTCVVDELGGVVTFLVLDFVGVLVVVDNVVVTGGA